MAASVSRFAADCWLHVRGGCITLICEQPSLQRSFATNAYRHDSTSFGFRHTIASQVLVQHGTWAGPQQTTALCVKELALSIPDGLELER